MLLAIFSDAFVACLCAFAVIYSLCFLFYGIFLPKSAEAFSFNRFCAIMRSFNQEGEK